MQLRMLVTVVLVAVALGIVGIAYAAPEVAEKLPIIGPTFKAVYYANVQYTANVSDFWGTMWFTEVNVTLEKKIIPFSIGPFGFGAGTKNAKVVIESSLNGVIIERFERDMSIEIGWFQADGWKTFTDRVKLGVEGSGTYDIKLTLYDDSGQPKDTEVLSRTI